MDKIVCTVHKLKVKHNVML